MFGIGYALCEGSKFTASQKAVLGGIAGAFAGTLTGAIVGALLQKTFIIGKNKEHFAAMKARLLR